MYSVVVPVVVVLFTGSSTSRDGASSPLLWAEENPTASFMSAGIAGASEPGTEPVFVLSSDDGFIQALASNATAAKSSGTFMVKAVETSTVAALPLIWNVSAGPGFEATSADTARNIDAAAAGQVDVVVAATSTSNVGGGTRAGTTCAVLGLLGQVAACDRIKWRYQIDCARAGEGAALPVVTISDDGSVAFLAVVATSSSSSSSRSSKKTGTLGGAFLHALDAQSGALLWVFAPPVHSLPSTTATTTGYLSTSRDGTATAWAVGDVVYIVNKSTGKLRAPPVRRTLPGPATLCPMGIFLIFGGRVVDGGDGGSGSAGATILEWSSTSSTYARAPHQPLANTAAWTAVSHTTSKNGGPPPNKDGCLVAICWTSNSVEGGDGLAGSGGSSLHNSLHSSSSSSSSSGGVARVTVASLLTGKVLLDWRSVRTSPAAHRPSIAMHMNYAAVVSGRSVLLFDVVHGSSSAKSPVMNYTTPVSGAIISMVDVLLANSSARRNGTSPGTVLVVASGIRGDSDVGDAAVAGIAYGFGLKTFLNLTTR